MEGGSRVVIKLDHHSQWQIRQASTSVAMVPIAPQPRPTSTQRLLVSMTRADLARHTSASKPLASSDEALAALAPVCTVLMVAIGWLSLETLCSTTASTVG